MEIEAAMEKLFSSDRPDFVDAAITFAQGIASSDSESPDRKADLINRVIDRGRNAPRVTNALLEELVHISLGCKPTGQAYFWLGMVTGRTGRPYQSIAAYMNAIGYDYQNPSLCYLNAGNRFREQNDTAIALTFFEKSIALNDKQQKAWLGAAALYAGTNKVADAVRCYQGYLNWYEALPPNLTYEDASQLAEAAYNYIKQNG